MTATLWVILGPEELPPAAVGSSLLGQARLLTPADGQVTLVLAGTGQAVQELPAPGADRILLLDGADGGADPVAAVEAIGDRLWQARPDACLVSASPWGSEFAGRLAARLGAALLPGCIGVTRDADGRIQGRRPVYGSRLVADVAASFDVTLVITLRPGAEGEGAAPAVGRAAGVWERIACRPRTGWIRALGQEGVPSEALDLAEADVVIAGGLGVGSREGFALVEELASLLGGAVGATRMAVDAGWAPFSRQIGLTGRIISPRVYVACGISGSPHHMDGVREAGLVVAINTDRHAPVFTYADVGILGDVRELLPALITAARRLRPDPAEAAEFLRNAGGGMPAAEARR